MIESVANFGPASGLVGVLAEPGERSQPDLAVVILNAGVIHRVGPRRLHVRLARTIAESGLPTFRLDMAGIGDSDGMGTAESQDEECMLSITATLDLLEERGTARRFVLYGACSGAVYAFRYARRDPRVVGVVGSDPETLERTHKYYWVRALAAARRPEVWYRLLRGRYKLVRYLRDRGGLRQKASVPVIRRHEEAMRAFTEMARREVRFLLVVTGWGTQRYNYERQLFDLFPGIGLEDLTRIIFRPGADHTFSREADRLVLEHEIVTWLDDAPFSDVPPPTGTLDSNSEPVTRPTT